MSRDSGPVMPLEQKCIRPGEWVVEGWRVRRIKDNDDYIRGWWRAASFGETFERRTLKEIREFIAGRKEREA